MNSKSLPAAVLLSGVVGTLPAVFADAAEAAPQQNQQITRRIKVSANTANLEEYRKLAEFAKDLGATHLGADQIEPSMWQWNADRRDPYPNWSLQRPTLFKYIVPKELEKYLPADYAKRNLDTLAARVKILKEFGLKATFNGMEPAYLPEQAYREHPEWRGPRCDQTRRSRKAYYAPCLDNPEMRRIYVDAVAELCKTAPFETFELMTNDSGGGLCWYPRLYPGQNGPAACYAVPLADRIVNFLSIFQEGAAKAGIPDAEVNLSRYFTAADIENALPKLKKNQAIAGRTTQGKSFSTTIGYMSGHNEHTYPVAGLSRIVKIASQLQAAQRNPRTNINIALRSINDFDAIRFLRKYFGTTIPQGLLGRYQVLTDFAADFVGKEHADRLVQAWNNIEQAYTLLEHLNTGGHIFTLGTVHQRWLTRPLVAFPGELKPEEKDYYRAFQFQAQSEAEADDLLDLQGYRWLAGYGALFAYRNTFWGAFAPQVREAAAIFKDLVPHAKDGEIAHYLEMQSKKAEMYLCIAQNALHVISYQEILDRTDYTQKPVDTTLDAFEQGDIRLYKLERIMRDEINNTVKIIRLIESTPEPLLQHAPGDDMESVMILGTREKLLKDLYRKIEVMENHRNDPVRLYKNYNR